MRSSEFWNRALLGRWSKAVLLGLTIALLGVLVAATPAGEQLEEDLGLGWLFAVRGPVDPPGGVVIVAIDEQSARELHLPERPSAWPRSVHAELVRHLSKSGASVVAFDLTFEAPAAKPEQDEDFAEAIRSAGNVLLAESIRRDTLHIPSIGPTATGNAVIESRSAPTPVLQRAASGSAPFMLPKVSRVDTYWTFVDDARLTPTLPVLAFQTFAHLTSGVAATRPRRDTELATGPRIRDGLARKLLDLQMSAETRYLNFYGPPRTIATVPYSQALAEARARPSDRTGREGESRFQGKAVWIGYAAATPAGQDRLRDDYRTVYSQGNGLDLSGVEIAATAFANLVEGRALQPAGPAWQLAIVGLWGFAMGFVCRLARPIVAIVIVVAISWVYLGVVLARFSEAAVWLPSVIPVGVQATLALFAGVWLSYRDSSREREGIKRAFGYFLPRKVVDQISRNLGPVTGSNQVLFGACLATDAEKYTSLAEQTEPGRLGALMNEYYAQLFVPVERSQGVVADVVGDSMIAVWARTSSEVDVRRSACRATLEIARSLDAFNEDSSADRPPLPTRFGLHSGDMLFGNIGASEHFEYRAVGDIVNTASRIQGLNKVLGTRILASAETVHGLDEAFLVRPLGSFLLAGKAKPVAVVELLSQPPGDPETSRRILDFSLALEAFSTRRWQEAVDAFSRLLEVDPQDAPSRFYLAYCERVRQQPQDGAWSPTIRIDSK